MTLATVALSILTAVVFGLGAAARHYYGRQVVGLSRTFTAAGDDGGAGRD